MAEKEFPLGRVALGVAVVHAGVAVCACVASGDFAFLAAYLAGLAPPLLVMGRRAASRRDRRGAVGMVVLQAAIGIPLMGQTFTAEGLSAAFAAITAGLFVLGSGFLTLLYVVFRIPADASSPPMRAGRRSRKPGIMSK